MHLVSAAGTACLVFLQGCQVRALWGCSTRRISHGIMKELITGPSQPSQRKITQQAFWKKAPLQFCSQSTGVGLPSASSSDCRSCHQPNPMFCREVPQGSVASCHTIFEGSWHWMRTQSGMFTHNSWHYSTHMHIQLHEYVWYRLRAP